MSCIPAEVEAEYCSWRWSTFLDNKYTFMNTEFVQKCQYCQFCVLQENSIFTRYPSTPLIPLLNRYCTRVNTTRYPSYVFKLFENVYLPTRKIRLRIYYGTSAIYVSCDDIVDKLLEKARSIHGAFPFVVKTQKFCACFVCLRLQMHL